MKPNNIVSMAKSSKIMRKSIFTFLKNYQYFTSIASLLALPFSLSLLLSQAFFFSSSSSVFSPSPVFSSVFSLKLCQSISSFILTLPFSLSFLILAKSAAFHPLVTNTQPFVGSLWNLYSSLFSTHLLTSILIFSINTAFFSLVFCINTAPWWSPLALAMGAVLYSVVMANATVLSTVALAYSGVEGKGGFSAIICSYSIIRSRTSTALALAVPTGLGLATFESLFHFRIITPSYTTTTFKVSSIEVWLVAFEAVLIAYLYSIILVLDGITSCFFYQSCKDHYPRQPAVDGENGYQYDNFEEFV